MTQPPFDLVQAHRWFAVELNNVAWDLVETPARSPDEVERMIHAAHAACHHWLQVGLPLNHQRALCLLATAYVVAGRIEPAVHYAAHCLALSDRNGETQSAFDRATAFGCSSVAAEAAGAHDRAEVFYEQALDAATKFEDADDRNVFARLYPPPPSV
ncbi:MAG: hypothetical protein HZA46_07240 [Planctomycetales bacterium]|nr:hypothetical protein [Planctomycetales bacterium]